MAKSWVNGKILDSSKNTISVMDRGFLLSDGVFETMYFDGGVVEDYLYHMLRLKNTLSDLLIPYYANEDTMLGFIRQTMQANNLCNGAVRITVTRGIGGRGIAISAEQNPTTVITVSSVERLRSPAKMKISEYTRNDTSPLASLKTMAYGDNVMALADAERLGFNEALMLNTKGRVCCASAGNVFFVLGNNLITPDLSQGCLAGITRSRIMKIAKGMGIGVQERAVSLDDIKNADAVFITNSIVKLRLVAILENTFYDTNNLIVERIKSKL